MCIVPSAMILVFGPQWDQIYPPGVYGSATAFLLATTNVMIHFRPTGDVNVVGIVMDPHPAAAFYPASVGNAPRRRCSSAGATLFARRAGPSWTCRRDRLLLADGHGHPSAIRRPSHASPAATGPVAAGWDGRHGRHGGHCYHWTRMASRSRATWPGLHLFTRHDRPALESRDRRARAWSTTSS